MDIKGMAKLLAKVVQEQVDVTAYLANPNAARPSGQSLCSVKFFNSEQIGVDFLSYKDPEVITPEYDLIEVATGLREVVFTLNFQKDLSNQNAINMRQCFYKSRVREEFTKQGLVWVSSTEPVNGTEPVDGAFEERSSMDVTLRVVMTTEDVINSIQELNIAVKAKQSQDYEHIIEVK